MARAMHGTLSSKKWDNFLHYESYDRLLYHQIMEDFKRQHKDECSTHMSCIEERVHCPKITLLFILSISLNSEFYNTF